VVATPLGTEPRILVPKGSLTKWTCSTAPLIRIKTESGVPIVGTFTRKFLGILCNLMCMLPGWRTCVLWPFSFASVLQKTGDRQPVVSTDLGKNPSESRSGRSTWGLALAVRPPLTPDANEPDTRQKIGETFPTPRLPGNPYKHRRWSTRFSSRAGRRPRR